MILTFKEVYLHSYGCAVSEKVAKQLSSAKIDHIFKDDLGEECSFEKGERAYLSKACDAAIRKSTLQMNELDCAIGADLNNQLSASHYFIRDYEIPFIGMYAACASSALLFNQAAMMIEAKQAHNILLFTSSNYGAASKQFRYPNTYGEQKKESATTTLTGAGAIILSNIPSTICIKEGFIGRVIDWHYNNVADMGGAMAPAVYQNFIEYLNQTKYQIDDFDCIATGDLSKVGFHSFAQLLMQDHINVDQRFMDCGLHVFDMQKNDVFSGGSGPACSMVVLICELLDKLEKGIYHRILLLASGALFNPIAIYQKESIPCICHGIVLERCIS